MTREHVFGKDRRSFLSRFSGTRVHGLFKFTVVLTSVYSHNKDLYYFMVDKTQPNWSNECVFVVDITFDTRLSLCVNL